MVGANVKAETMSLMDRRAALEAEMDALFASLSRPGGPGISDPLVDAEGFPRADIDILAVRAQRNRLAELRTDHKDITEKIDKNLQILYSAKLPQNVAVPVTSGGSVSLHDGWAQSDPMEEDPVVANYSTPFAMIDEIADDSPAAEDGLKLGDEVVKFGSVEVGDRLQERLISKAMSSQGSPVSLVIIRQGSLTNLTITPRQWRGRGLLGCHFRIL